jgi:phosphate transport system ATP-binding protein
VTDVVRPAMPERRDAPPVPPAFETRALTAGFGGVEVVRDVSLQVAPGRVTAVIGPSGCGKSTLLRCLNRLHETVPTAFVRGDVLRDGRDIHDASVDPVALRREIGFVAQRPTPFPTLSIRQNVLAGLRAARREPPAADRGAFVETALRRAGLWDEVQDRLDRDPMALSGGQQQRLCLARALAPAPRVLLLDEPTSALDPISTQRIEELVYTLRGDVTIVMVTHNMQQAARVADQTAFLLDGALVEMAPTRTLFTTPADPRTEAYVTGRFG